MQTTSIKSDTDITLFNHQNSLHFGPGGVPLSTRIISDNGNKLDQRNSGLHRLEEMNLNLMEIEFVHGVRISELAASSLGKKAKEKGIDLTVHGPYYINLASSDPAIYHASIGRVQKTIEAALWMGAKSLTFHAGFYQKRTQEETTSVIEEALYKCVTESEFLTIDPEQRPLISIETTGKPSQWGSLDEILEVAKTLNQKLSANIFSVCVDFAHIYARSGGNWNSPEEFTEILNKVQKMLGVKALHRLHMHVSGIEYTPKGERKHLTFATSEFKYKDLLRALHEKQVSGWLVCESPILEDDAVLLRDEYNRISE